MSVVTETEELALSLSPSERAKLAEKQLDEMISNRFSQCT